MRLSGFVFLLLAAATSAFAPPAEAATLKVLHDFCSSANCADGRRPMGVVMDSAGRIYGTAGVGGNGDTGGTAYMLEPQDGGGWKFSVLYSFCSKAHCADGGGPEGNLIIDTNGALYGVTGIGGTELHREGTVFRLSPNAKRTKWKLKLLHSFCDTPCREGEIPPSGLAYQGQKDGLPYDGVSPLYGVARGGPPVQGCGGSCGLAYRVYPKTKRKWGFSVVYNFCSQAQCKDGWQPVTDLVVQNPTTLLGVSSHGGEWGSGLLFKLTKASGAPSWNHTTMISFCASTCEDGSFPYASPVLGADGSIYGTTGVGRSPLGGSLWKLAPNQQESVLYKFCQQFDCQDGDLALDIVRNSAGDIYGATEQGGGHDIDRQSVGGGTLYKYAGGTPATLWRFCSQANCADGEYPGGTMVLAPNGKLYGTTFEGGADGGGTVYELTP